MKVVPCGIFSHFFIQGADSGSACRCASRLPGFPALEDGGNGWLRDCRKLDSRIDGFRFL